MATLNMAMMAAGMASKERTGMKHEGSRKCICSLLGFRSFGGLKIWRVSKPPLLIQLKV